MGKTTLLLRLAHSLVEDPALQEVWLPVRFDEEQYNIGELADFWLNCFQKLSEDTGDPALSQTAEQLARDYKGEELEEASLLRLREYSRQKGKALLLLVDNFDLLLTRIDNRETHRLREVLQKETWLMLVGASAHPVLESFDYKSPFYDFFHVIPLEPLNLDETLNFLRTLGHRFHREEETERLLSERRADFAVLHTLVGGNLRTTAMLFSLLGENPTAELSLLLDRLLDQYTSTFKDVIEALPAQGQRVFDALARLWDPATAENVAKELRIDRGIASAQLHRLVDRSLAVKVPLPQRSIGFKIRDRFLNLWYLMRSGRGQRHQLNALLGFLDLFCRPPASGGKELESFATELRRMDLISDATIQEAKDEALRLSEDGEALQRTLSVSTNAHLLALYLSGKSAEAESEALKLLKFRRDDLFACALACRLKAQRGDTREALALLLEGAPSTLPLRLQFERARLLIELGKAQEAAILLMPLLESEEITPTEIAATAVLIVRKGDQEAGWLAELLLNKAAARDPETPIIPLAGCEVEIALDHPKQAMAQFRKALSATRRDDSLNQEVLATALRLAGDQPMEVLAELKGVGLDREWRPLANALAFLGGESDRLEKLSPEMRTFTENVVASIQKTHSPVPLVGS